VVEGRRGREGSSDGAGEAGKLARMDMNERIERLEARVASLRRLCVGMGVVACLAVGGVLWVDRTADAPGEEIRARKVVVEDEEGRDAITLAIGKGGPFVHVVGGEGRMGIMMMDSAKGPQLLLFDEREKPRAWLAVDDGRPVLTFADAEGAVRAAFALGGESGRNDPLLVMEDERGAQRLSLGVGTSGADLTIGDAADKPRIVLRSAADGAFAAVLDERGAPIWEMPRK
jgi:hypothetical protein